MKLSQSSCRGFALGVVVALLVATALTLPMISDLGERMRILGKKDLALQSDLADMESKIFALKLEQEKTLPLLPNFPSEDKNASGFIPGGKADAFDLRSLPPLILPEDLLPNQLQNRKETEPKTRSSPFFTLPDPFGIWWCCRSRMKEDI